MQLGWKGTGRQEELWVHPRSREPGAWLWLACSVQRGQDAGAITCIPRLQWTVCPAPMLSCSEHCAHLHPHPTRSSVAPRSLAPHRSCSWFLIPASTQQCCWHRVPSPGWLTGTICCPGAFSPLSLLLAKSLEEEPDQRGVVEGGTGCAAPALPLLGQDEVVPPHARVKGMLPPTLGAESLRDKCCRQRRPRRGMSSLLIPLGRRQPGMGAFPNEKQSPSLGPVPVKMNLCLCFRCHVLRGQSRGSVERGGTGQRGGGILAGEHPWAAGSLRALDGSRTIPTPLVVSRLGLRRAE